MQAILKDINAVMGVNGSFVTDATGHLLARALPEVFDAPTLELVGRNLAQTYTGLEASRRRKVGDLDLVFADGRLIAKRAGDGTLCILCVKKINVALLNLTANVGVKRLNDILKPAPTKKEPRPAQAEAPTVTAPPAAAPPVAEEPKAVPTLPRVQQAMAIVTAAREKKVVLRAMGDAAIRLRCPSASMLADPAEENFLQLGGHHRQAGDIENVLKGLGCIADTRFNVLNGGQRLRFAHPETKLPIEVVLDELISFHRVEFGPRMHLEEVTLTPADLFLCQVQIVNPREMDLQRLLAILADFDIGGAGELRAIDGAVVSGLCAEDWGWYKTVTMNLAKAESAAAGFQGGRCGDDIRKRARRLIDMIEEAPKSLRWQVRARVGERQQWYEVPE